MKRIVPYLIAAALAGCSGVAPSGFESPGSRRALLNSAVPESRIAYYVDAIARNPNDTSALRGLGNEYARQAAWQESAGAYREALILNGSDVDALLGFGRAQLALGDAAGAYRSALSITSGRNRLSALLLAGVALDMTGQRAEAMSYYQQALDGNGRDLDVRNNIALSMALAGNPAAYDAMQSVAYAPDADGRHHRNLVLVAAMLGQSVRASSDAARLGIGATERDAITAIASRARLQGAMALGLASFG